MDMTKKNDWSARKQADYGVPGLPTVIFYNGSGQEVKRFFGFRSPQEVAALMKDVR
jgi:thiol:disulfide interchange protein